MLLKVLHIVSLDKENYYLRNLSEYCRADEANHSFVTFASGSSEFVMEMRKIGRPAFGLDLFGRTQFFKAWRRLNDHFHRIDPDVVHVHLFNPSLIGLTAAKLQGRKTVLTRHHSDAVHQIASPLKRVFYLGLDKYISNRSDHIIAPSLMVRDILVETEGVDDRKVSVIPYGQTTERFDAVTPEKIAAVREELGMGNELSLVCVSRLFDRKGHIYLFEALAAMFRDGLRACLYLVGAGDYQGVLERKAAEFGISEKVTFLGWRNDALAIVAASDVVVHPSLEDALSSAVIEAVMLGKPIVATDISGVRDSLDDGKYGEIVPPADAEGLRAGLERVLADIETARDRARQGRLYLLDYMDAKRVADAYIEVYRKVTNNA